MEFNFTYTGRQATTQEASMPASALTYPVGTYVTDRTGTRVRVVEQTGRFCAVGGEVLVVVTADLRSAGVRFGLTADCLTPEAPAHSGWQLSSGLVALGA